MELRQLIFNEMVMIKRHRNVYNVTDIRINSCLFIKISFNLGIEQKLILSLMFCYFKGYHAFYDVTENFRHFVN